MITINASPGNFSSVFQPVAFAISSNRTNAEIKMKCEIEQKISGSWELIATKIIDPDSISGSSSFTLYVQQELSSAIITALPQNAHGTVTNDTGSMIQYRVKFTELIYDAESLYVEADNETSAAKWASNVVIQASEDKEVGDYVLQVGGAGSALHDRPLQFSVKPGQPLVISYIYDENETPDVQPAIIMA